MSRFRAVWISAALIVLLLPIVSAQDPEMKYDDKDRLVMLDYPGTSDDISYSYYGDSDSIKKITASDAVYEYDANGNLVSEAYPSDAEKDRTYTYYADGNLRSVSGGGSTISYTYDSEGRVTAVYTEINGNTLFETYSYYPDGSLKTTKNALTTTAYVYDDAGNIIQETTTDQTGATARVFYEHDANGNVIRAYDSNGADISWEYEDVPYDCVQTICKDEDCTDYDLVNSTCSYSRLKSRTVGNYRVDIDYLNGTMAYRSNAWDGTVSPVERYDDNGLLVEDDEFYYTYDSDYGLASTTSKSTGETVDYTTNDDGFITHAEYSSGASEDYYYDPLGQVIKVTHTGADGTSKTYYAATAGDLNSLVEESAMSFAPTGAVIPPAAGPGTGNPKPETAKPTSAGGQPDYLFFAIIGIAILMAALIIRSRMRGR